MKKEKKNSLIWNTVPTLFERPQPPRHVTPKRPPPSTRTDPPPHKKGKNSKYKHIYYFLKTEYIEKGFLYVN